MDEGRLAQEGRQCSEAARRCLAEDCGMHMFEWGGGRLRPHPCFRSGFCGDNSSASIALHRRMEIIRPAFQFGAAEAAAG